MAPSPMRNAMLAASVDGGKTWMSAALSRDYGKYSFREWQMTATLPAYRIGWMIRLRVADVEDYPEAPETGAAIAAIRS